MRRAGFTLIELIVVLAVMAGAIAVVTPALGALDPAASGDAEQIMTLLQRARAHAQDAGEDVEVVIAPEAAKVWWNSVTMDSAWTLRLTEETRLGSSAERCRFRFAAVGLSWGDSLAVTHGGRTSVIFLDLRTGTPRRIEVGAGGPESR